MPPEAERRPETGHAEVVQIRTGHFRRQRQYAIYRSSGTPNYLLIFTRSGSGRFVHVRGTLATRPGEIVLFEPGTLHDYGTAPHAGAWELLWTHFHPKADWHRWLDFPVVAPGLRRLSLDDVEIRARVEQSLLEMNRLKGGPLRQSESLAMNKFEEVLLWSDLANPNSAVQRLDPRIRRALDLIESELGESLRLGDLARRCGLSRSRFSGLFRRQVGTTPQRHQEAQRLARARELLRLSETSISKIAEDLGFSTRFYFSLRFKRAFGVTPSAYRRIRGRPSSSVARPGRGTASV